MPQHQTDPLRTKALQVCELLAQLYGARPVVPSLDPVSQLVSTILSQNTNDVLRDKAFQSLVDRFPTWEAVRDAPLADVVDAIQIAGLSRQKAEHIQGALRRITAERGEISLDHLAKMDVAEAREWLTAMKGIGPKTAAIVLLFSLGLPAFPVDTHIYRVSRRLGLIPPKASREMAHVILERLFPPETYYAGHLNLIQHGRQVCQARRPRCEVCLLREICDYYEANVRASCNVNERDSNESDK